MSTSNLQYLECWNNSGFEKHLTVGKSYFIRPAGTSYMGLTEYFDVMIEGLWLANVDSGRFIGYEANK